jgi:hypothetical protein
VARDQSIGANTAEVRLVGGSEERLVKMGGHCKTARQGWGEGEGGGRWSTRYWLRKGVWVCWWLAEAATWLKLQLWDECCGLRGPAPRGGTQGRYLGE